MVYGYARISTAAQNIERQIRNIKAATPDAVIVQEAFTGTKASRPEWDKLRRRLKDGDTVIFDSVSRMSRNAADGFALYEKLYNEGVTLVFLKEPHINTDTYKDALKCGVQLTGGTVDYILEGVNRYLLALAKEQIRLAFEQSEKEVLDLHQRTKEGIETARLNGKQIGIKQGQKLTTKKSITAKAEILKHCKAFGGTLSDGDCIRLIGIARNTFYKYKAELLQDEGDKQMDKQYFDTRAEAEEYKRKHGLAVRVVEYLPCRDKYALVFPVNAQITPTVLKI